MSIPDPYRVLQVDPDAADDVIEAAYKRLAKRYHPDVAPGPGAQERMVQLNQARDMLRDPVRRAAVDRARARAEGTLARVIADRGRHEAGARPGTPYPGPRSSREAGAPGGANAGWPFPGMQEPGQGDFRAGSASIGSAHGGGAAGPPPGNPSGSRITFGRYQGWTLGEVARTDLEYLEWLDRMPIGRIYQAEIDVLLRQHGRRASADDGPRHGLHRRR